MGTNLSFCVYGDVPAVRAAYAEIDAVVARMNVCFTWEHGGLKLYRREPPYLDESDPDELVVFGSADGGSIWNALLVVEFAAWLSRRLPDHRIGVEDKRRFYVRTLFLDFRRGVPELVSGRSLVRSYGLDGLGHGDTPGVPVNADADALRHAFFARPSARGFARLPEIAALGLPEETIARMTLGEVAARIVFPWEAEGLASV
jgi:hypothetical protein